ncbi:hypothetical protein K0M31_012094, partial [Melipona bicolor]
GKVDWNRAAEEARFVQSLKSSIPSSLSEVCGLSSRIEGQRSREPHRGLLETRDVTTF